MIKQWEIEKFDIIKDYPTFDFWGNIALTTVFRVRIRKIKGKKKRTFGCSVLVKDPIEADNFLKYIREFADEIEKEIVRRDI